MRCLACGAVMQLEGIAQCDPEGEPLLIRGFERRTFKCLECGQVEKRLVFSRNREHDGPVENFPAASSSISAVDNVQQEHVVLPAEPISAPPADNIQQEDVAVRDEQVSVSSGDNFELDHAAHSSRQLVLSTPIVERKDATVPAELSSVSPAALQPSWVQTLEKLQQRCTALSQEAARQRAAKVFPGKLALARKRKEADRLRGSVAVLDPLLRESTSLPNAAAKGSREETVDRLPDGLAVHNPLPRESMSLHRAAIEATPEEGREFEKLWESLAERIPPPLAASSQLDTSPARSSEEADPLIERKAAPMPTPLAAMPANSDEPDQQFDNLPIPLPPRLLPKLSPKYASPPDAIRQSPVLDVVPWGSSEVQGQGGAEAPRTVWVRAIAALLPTRVRIAVKQVILRAHAAKGKTDWR